jgi:hypothetical protein
MDPLSVAPASLLEAMDHADAVISTAAGYTRHSKGDTDKIDTIGNRNLGDAASQAGVRRFVLTQHPDMRPDSADTPPRARTALRAGPPAGRGFPQWGVRCCRLRDRLVRQAVDLASGQAPTCQRSRPVRRRKRGRLAR